MLLTGITGGFGKKILDTFIKDNYFVIGTYAKNAQKAKELVGRYTSKNLEIYQMDQRNLENVSRVTQKIILDYPVIDVLILNAGITRDSFIFNMTENNWSEVIDTNLLGAIQVAKNIFPVMRRNKFGRIIIMSSVSGVYGREGQVNYSLSKGGLIGLSQLLGSMVDLNEDIIVNTLAPGMIKTEMLDMSNQKNVNQFLKACCAKRVGDTSDVAELTRFLASKSNCYSQNTLFQIDGGFMKC